MRNNDELKGNAQEDFKIWVNRQPRGAGQLGFSGAVIKPGPKAFKTVTLADYGDQETGEIRERVLRFRTHERRKDGQPGWDFDETDPKTVWRCENEEIEKVLAFLHSTVAKTGRYRVVDAESPVAALLDLLASGDVDPQALVDGLIRQGDVGKIVALLAASDAGLSAAESAVVAQRRRLVARLQSLVRNPATTETDVQQLIGSCYWLFGGRYVGVADRRNLAPLDQHDIPLLGADGTLHIIELKGPNIPALVRRYRNHCIVGTEVHEATTQAMNYIRSFDELGASLTTIYRNELGDEYDMRRVFATVVIGHPSHVVRGIDERMIQQAIRSYNAHLSRVEVITYKDLADAAERALVFEEQSPHARPSSPESNRGDDPWATARSDPWAIDEPPF